MSKTYCRFCDISTVGLYLHCPRCGAWLPPKDALPAGEKLVINSEPFEIAEFGKSWNFTGAIDRFEVIDDTGRAYVKGSIYGTPVRIEQSYQDDGKTLKVFVEGRITKR